GLTDLSCGLLMFGHSSNDSHLAETCICMYIQRGSGAHDRNGRDPAVDQEVCPDDVRGIVRREVNCQLRDFHRIGQPLARIVCPQQPLDRITLLFAWETTEHRRVSRAWA